MEKGHTVSPSLLTSSPLRIGLLVDTTNVSKYVYAFAEWAQARQNIVSVTHLILHAPNQSIPAKSSMLHKLRSIRRDGIYVTTCEAIFKIILTVERFLLRRNKRHQDHLHTFDLSSLVVNAINISPIVSKSGFVYRFTANDIQKLKGLKFDLLIRCGNGILRGDILEASRLGIISFHHADNRINRGGPAGFWEVYYRQDTTGFTIQRLTEELDGGDVLMRGHFPTYHYYLLNQAALFEKSNYYLKLLVEQIALSRKLPNPIPNTPYSNKLFRSPRIGEVSIYVCRLCSLVLKRKFRRAVGIEYRWGIAYTRSSWKNAVLWRSTKVKSPPLHFLADPFVISKNGKDFCFVEDFDYLKQRANIAVYELTNGGSTRIGTALEEQFHLSFPYIFEYQGELYMCPETAENRDIRIYRCIEFPLRWELKKIVMEKISAADTMFFEKNGKWWMFTNIDPIESGDHCSELFIFSSNSPLGHSWTPHPLNPIFVDASRARNAGLVKDGDTYFRISQRQGFDMYGKRSLINKISELTDSNYVEVPISEVTPNFGKGVVGTHHLHSNGKVTVFDFVTLARIRA